MLSTELSSGSRGGLQKQGEQDNPAGDYKDPQSSQGLNPSDLLLHSVFHNHSLVQNRSFSVKSTAEIFVLDNSSTLDISELCGLLLEGKNGLNNTDKVAAGTF